VNDAPALKQAEVGVAVSNATDVAKRSASAIMLKDGLSGILDLIAVGRNIHGRLTTWVLNYIIKTWQQSVFVMVIFWLRGQFPVSSIHLLLRIILLDAVTLALSSDQARFPRQPSVWRLVRLVLIGASVGFLNLLELIGGYYYAVKISDSGYQANLNLLQTYCFLMMLPFWLLSIVILRERDFFFRHRVRLRRCDHSRVGQRDVHLAVSHSGLGSGIDSAVRVGDTVHHKHQRSGQGVAVQNLLARRSVITQLLQNRTKHRQPLKRSPVFCVFFVFVVCQCCS